MPRFRKLETLEDFQRALKNKYGFGEGSGYKPWLRVQDVKSHGNSGKIQGIKTNREHHTFSEHESCFFYIAEFCDSVIDIREQFPLLPLDLSVKIAQTLDVKHPTNPRSKIFNIMTTDFVLSCSDGRRKWYEAVAVKPADQLKDLRVAEKLDIERIWWELLGIRFHIFVMTPLNKIQSKNIQWFTSPLRQGHSLSDVKIAQSLSFIRKGTLYIEDLCNLFIREMDIEHNDALVLLKVLIARKFIVVDITRPIADTGILEITQISNDLGVHSYAS
jgi:hypothetical protein